MKRIFLFLFSITTFTLAANAQSAQYTEAMEKQVAAIDKNASSEELTQAGNTFERIAEVEKTQWLPYYYAAYCKVMQALSAKGNTIDALADQAEQHAEKAEALSKNNSEIAVIRSLIATARINVDPMVRGRKYGPISSGFLEAAKKYNADNPRIYMLEGQSLYYTPEQFGGSKVRAKEKFELSLKKFSTFRPESSIAPHWGEEYTKKLLSSIGN